MTKFINPALLSSLLILSLLAAKIATAEELPDPTRPPAAFQADAHTDGADTASGPVLQSILIGPNRREAIISGKTVKTGEKFGSATVIQISESQVTLKNGKDIEVLKLFPGIEKRPSHGRAGVKSDYRTQ